MILQSWRCKEIGPSTKDNIESFSQNASIGKSAKYRFIHGLHRFSCSRKAQLDRTDGLVTGPGASLRNASAP